jgi:GNAT superfamily N-acetyltransferase
VGTIGVRLRVDGALVFGLGVVPEARRQGHALALVGAAAREARAQGCRTLHVQSEEPALPFWTAAGFVPTTRWRSFTPSP